MFLLLSCASRLGFQDTSNVVFCDNLPSAAPSVHWTERAARHFQQRLDSIRDRFLSQPFSVAVIFTGRQKSSRIRQPLFLIPMRCCLRIETTFPKLFSTWRKAWQTSREAAILAAATAKCDLKVKEHHLTLNVFVTEVATRTVVLHNESCIPVPCVAKADSLVL